MGNGNSPSGLAFDSSGNLYVGYQDPEDIWKFDSHGNGSFFANADSNPLGLAFDSSGYLYVADENGDGIIEKYDTNGVESVFASGLVDPVGIAIQVPEPSTWALLAMSIGTLLGGLRLRR